MVPIIEVLQPTTILSKAAREAVQGLNTAREAACTIVTQSATA